MAPGHESDRSPPQTCKQCKITKEKIERKEKLICLLKDYIQVKGKRGPSKVSLVPHQFNSLRSIAFEDSVKVQKELSELVKCTKNNLQLHAEERKKIEELRLSVDDKEAKLNLFNFEQKQLAESVKLKEEKIQILEDKVKRLTSSSESCTCGSNITSKKKRKPKDRHSDGGSEVASPVSEFPHTVGSTNSVFPHAGPSTGPSFILTPASSTTSSVLVPGNVTSPDITWDSVSCIGSPLRDTKPQPSTPTQSEVGGESQSKFYGIFQSPDKSPPAEDTCYLGCDSAARNIFDSSNSECAVTVNSAESEDISKCDTPSKGLARDRDKTSKNAVTPQKSGIAADQKKTASPEMPSIFDISPTDVEPASICDNKTDSKELNKSESKADCDDDDDDVGIMDVSHADEESDTEDWIIPSSDDPKSYLNPKSPGQTEHSANQSKNDENPGTGVIQSNDLISPSTNCSITASPSTKVMPLASFLESISAQSQQQSTLKSSSSMSNSAQSEHDDGNAPLKSSSSTSSFERVSSYSPSKSVSELPQRSETPSRPNRLSESDSNESHIFPSPDLRALLNSEGVKPLVTPIKSQRSTPTKTSASKSPLNTRKPSSVSPRSRHSSESPKKKLGTPKNTPAKKSGTELTLPLKDSPYKALGLELTDDSETEDEASWPGLVGRQSESSKKHTTPQCNQEQDLLANLQRRSSPFHKKLHAISKERTASSSNYAEFGEASSEFIAARVDQVGITENSCDLLMVEPIINNQMCAQRSEVGLDCYKPTSLEIEPTELSAIQGNDDSMQNGEETPRHPSSIEIRNDESDSNGPETSPDLLAVDSELPTNQGNDDSIQNGEKSLRKRPAFEILYHESDSNLPQTSSDFLNSGSEPSTNQGNDDSIQNGEKSPRNPAAKILNDDLDSKGPPKIPDFLGVDSKMSVSQGNDNVIRNEKKSPRKPSALESLTDESDSNGSPNSPGFLGFESEHVSRDFLRFSKWLHSGAQATPATQPEVQPMFPILSSNPRSGILTCSAARLPTASVSLDSTPFNLKNCPSFSDWKTTQPFSGWKTKQSFSSWKTQRQPEWDPIAPICRSLQHLSIAATSSTTTNPFYSVSHGNSGFPFRKGNTCTNHAIPDPRRSSCHDNFAAFRPLGNRGEPDERNFIMSEIVEIKQEDSPVTYKVQQSKFVHLHKPVLDYLSNAMSSRSNQQNPTITEFIDLRCQNDCRNEHCCGRRSSQWPKNSSCPAGSRMFSWINNQNSPVLKAERPSSPSPCCSGSNPQSKASLQNPFTTWRGEKTKIPPAKMSQQNSFIWSEKHRSPFSDQRSPFSDKRSPISDQRPLFSDQRSLFSDQRSLFSDQRSLFSDQRSPFSDQRSPFSDPFTNWRGEQTNQTSPAKMSQQNSLAWSEKHRSPFSDQRSPFSDQRSLFSDQRCLFSDQRSLFSEQRSPFHQFQRFKVPDYNRSSRVNNANAFPPLHRGTSPNLSSMLQASTISGRCAPPHGSQGHAQPSHLAVSKKLKLASPKFKNRTPSRARSPKKTVNSCKNSSSQVPPKFPAPVKPNPATVEPNPQPLSSVSVREVNTVHRDLPIAEKKREKFHHTVETAMTLRKRKYHDSDPCVVHKSGDTVAVGKPVSPLSSNGIQTCAVESIDYDVTHSRVHKTPPKKPTNESLLQINKSPKHSIPAEKTGAAVFPSHAASPFKQQMDYPIPHSIEKSPKTARLSNILQSPIKTAVEPQVGLTVDSGSVGEPPSIISDDSSRAIETIEEHRLGTAAGDAADDTTQPGMPISAETLSAAKLTPFSPTKPPSVSVPVEHSIPKPALLPQPVCNNGTIRSPVLPKRNGKTITDASVYPETKTCMVVHRALSNTTSLLFHQNPPVHSKLNDGVAGSQKLVAEIPKELENSPPGSIKGSSVLSPTSQDLIPEVASKKKRIAHSPLKVVSSPLKPPKDHLSVKKSPPSKHFVKPLSNGRDEPQSNQGRCSGGFELRQSSVSHKPQPASLFTPKVDEGQPIRPEQSGRSRKNKKKKKGKAAVTSNAAVTFKVPAGVGVHPCPSCKFTPDCCACHVERMIREWVVSPALSPMCPSPEWLEAESHEIPGLSVSSENGEHGTTEEILQSQESNAPEHEFASSFSQIKVEDVALTDILMFNKTADSEPEMASERINVHPSQEVSPVSAAVGLDQSDDVAPADAYQPPKIENNENLSGGVDPCYNYENGNEEDMVVEEPSTKGANGVMDNCNDDGNLEVEGKGLPDDSGHIGCSEIERGQSEDVVSAFAAVNCGMGVEQPAVVCDSIKHEAVNSSVHDNKAAGSRPTPAGRRRKSCTSDTSIEDIEPVPKRRKSLRNRGFEQKVLRSRTVPLNRNTPWAPKAKPIQKRRVSKVIDKEEEAEEKCDVLSPPPARNLKKSPKKGSGRKSRSTESIFPHQDDAPCPSTPEEPTSSPPFSPNKIPKLTKRRRSSRKTVRRVSEGSSALFHSSDSEPEEKYSKQLDQSAKKPMKDVPKPVALNLNEKVHKTSESAKLTSEPVASNAAEDVPKTSESAKLTSEPVASKAAEDVPKISESAKLTSEPVASNAAEDVPKTSESAKLTSEPVASNAAEDVPKISESAKLTSEPVASNAAEDVPKSFKPVESTLESLASKSIEVPKSFRPVESTLESLASKSIEVPKSFRPVESTSESLTSKSTEEVPKSFRPVESTLESLASKSTEEVTKSFRPVESTLQSLASKSIEVPKMIKSTDSTSEGLNKKDVTHSGKPDLVGWLKLKNSVVEARKTKVSPLKTPKPPIGQRTLPDVVNRPTSEAKRVEVTPSGAVSVPIVQTTSKAAEEDRLLSQDGLNESNSSHHLRNGLLDKCGLYSAGESFKNDPDIPLVPNAFSPGSSLPEGRKNTDIIPGVHVSVLEKSNSPYSAEIKTECQPLAITNVYSSYTHQVRPYSQVNQRSSVLSHVGQFFGNRGAKPDERKSTDGACMEEGPKESSHFEQNTSTAHLGFSNYLPSADARTDSEVDSDQEMVIDYNSGSEAPNSPRPGMSSPSQKLDPSNFGCYNQKVSERLGMGETTSTSQKVSANLDMTGRPSTSQSFPTPQSIGFYSTDHSQNSSSAPAPDAPSTSRCSLVPQFSGFYSATQNMNSSDEPAEAPSTSWHSPVPQFSGFYSTEPTPTSTESNAEPAKKLVSFRTDEKVICVPIPEDNMIPCCINIVGFAEHYQLSKAHQLRTIKPFCEARQDVKLKICNQLNKYILNADGDHSLIYLKSFLSASKILPTQLAKVLCEMLVESKPKPVPPREEAKGIPSYLSITQKKAVVLLVDLGRGDLTFFDRVLTVMEQFLSTNPTEQSESLKKGTGYGNIAAVYGLLCRSQGFVLRAQSFIFDVIYGRHISYFSIIYKIICMVPNAMPYAGPNNGPLTYTIGYILMKQGIYKQVNETELTMYGVTVLRKRLQHKYGYSFPTDLTRDHVMDELINNVMAKGSDKAIVLLCKNQGYRWAHGVALRYIFPFLDKVISGVEQDEFKISRYITILGEMSRGFATAICTPFVKKSLEMLQDLLQNPPNPSVMVSESVISALVHFQRLDLQWVTHILCSWAPPEGKVSLGSIKAVKRILTGKKLGYWKTLAPLT